MTYDDVKKVYDSFRNIEFQYRESGKTRSEFMKRKLGGDITIGITILTDAMMGACSNEPACIDMFSELKDFFDFIRKHINNLDSLPTFEYKTLTDSNEIDALDILLKSAPKDYTQFICKQKDLYNTTGALHYKITKDIFRATNLLDCDIIGNFGKYTVPLLGLLFNDKANISEDTYYKHNKKKKTLKKIKSKDILKYMNA